MATKKSPTPVIKPRRALGVRAQLPEELVPSGPVAASANAVLTKGDLVTVVVPTPFPFTMQDHRIIQINAGVQEMPREIAEHWFVKSRGVTIYTKD